MKKLTCAAVLGLAALLFAPGDAHGRELVRKSFDGTGWAQSGGDAQAPLAVDFGGVARGSISFDLQRTGDIPPGTWETLFELRDGRDRRILRVRLNWSAVGAPGHPVLYFQGGGSGGGEYYHKGLGLWGPFVVLDRPVAMGERFQVDLTWDDGTGTYTVYVDGNPVPSRPEWFSTRSMGWEPDVRTGIDRERKKEGKKPVYESRPMGYFLKKAAVLYLGRHSSPPPDWELLGKSAPLRSALLQNFVVTVDEIPEPGKGATPLLRSVLHDAARVAGFSGKLVEGDRVTVTLDGSPGGAATFDVARLADLYGEIALEWKGWGVYLEEKVFYDEGEVNLRDVEGYRVYAGTVPPGEITEETEYVEELEVGEQSVVLKGLEPDTPYYISLMAVMEDGTFLPVTDHRRGLKMAETEGSPGTYEGTFTVGWSDRIPDAVVVGRLSFDENEVTLIGEETLEIDPSLTIAVDASPKELKADEKSTAGVTVTVANANGDSVSDHEIRFLLATTSQYTGVVGGGAFFDEVGGRLSRDFRAVTDLFGQVEVEYTAGFAAKTAIIVARDMESNDTGAGYVKTYINAAAELELEAVQEVAGKALGYSITVTSSDEWLTADGESEARITALVTKDGAPVKGHRVGFSVSSGAGTIRTVRGETDEDGKARALYTAGRKIGMVLITAVDHTVGITGSVQIELRSDAPAKIGVVVTPDMLPADGRSTADVAVVVTDINDNPNEDVAVEYRIAIGSGRLRDIDGMTDSGGESTAQYVAGLIPGKITIEVTVRSTVPTDEEMAAARDLALAVTDYDFY